MHVHENKTEGRIEPMKGNKATTNLGAMLRAYRAQRGIGVRALALEIGTSAATLSRVERGHAPDRVTFWALARWLDADAPAGVA